ncbi:MAG TPA: AsmA family protein [Terriglobales bacterium]|nr:AsmA family protein [Terriglobales bacterium]
MNRAIGKGKLRKVATALAVLLALVVFVLPHLISLDYWRPKVESLLGSALAREVHIGRLELSLLAGGLRAENFSIADDPTFSPVRFLDCKSLGIGVSLKELVFSHQLHVTSLTLSEPRVNLVRSPAGEWNFSTIGHSADTASVITEDVFAPSVPGSTQAFTFDQIKISDGLLVLPATGTTETKESTPVALQHVDVDLRNVALDRVMSFVVSGRNGDGGSIEVRGEAGPVSRATPEKTPFHAAIHVAGANLALSHASSGPSGLLSMDASIASDGSAAHSEGHGHVEKLRLVRAGTALSQRVSFSYATDYSLAKQTGVIRAGEISVGKGKAQLSGSYNLQGATVATHLKVSGSQIPLESVEAVLAAFGVQLPAGSAFRGGTLSANLSIDGRADRLLTTGKAEVDNARLEGFDLGSKLASIPGLSRLQAGTNLGIATLSSQFRISPEATQISNLKSELSGIGSVTGGGDIDAANRLQFEMVAHLTPLTRVVAPVCKLCRMMTNDIPFKVEGTTSHPIFLPDLSGMARSRATDLLAEAAKNALSPTETAPNHDKKKGRLWGQIFSHLENAASNQRY